VLYPLKKHFRCAQGQHFLEELFHGMGQWGSRSFGAKNNDLL
jgi:hypothetical protein